MIVFTLVAEEMVKDKHIQMQFVLALRKSLLKVSVE